MSGSYREFTVGTLTQELKGTLESGFSRIILSGEIGEFRRYPSGHCYFTLRDAGGDAQISCVMFRSAFEASAAKTGLREGARVSLFGSVSVYAQRGNYQFSVLRAKLQGVGELMQRFLELRARLEAEGLFDPARKRPLPSMPRRIGIVTSEAGAVIHDMCTVLIRRFPALEIRLHPSLVQGEAAPPTLIAGLRYFDALMTEDGSRPWADVVIIARGGGSFEDLFCFNDESLVRAVAAMRVPVISAVGHETDYTLCDFAADRRAGTPSIAAEIAVPVLTELQTRLRDLDSALARSLRAKGEWFAQRLDHLSALLAGGLDRCRERMEHRLDRAASRLALLSPYGVLERGYSLTTAADGSVIRDGAAVKAGDRLRTRFAAGGVESIVT